MHNYKEQLDYWKKSAEKNWDAANVLFKSRHYDFCLFTCHLAIEKLLKGLIVIDTKSMAPFTHDLERLAILAKLAPSKEQVENLKTITGFNMMGRYADEKFSFYKRCTKEYTGKYLKICEELFLWLKNQYPKK